MINGDPDTNFIVEHEFYWFYETETLTQIASSHKKANYDSKYRFGIIYRDLNFNFDSRR